MRLKHRLHHCHGILGGNLPHSHLFLVDLGMAYCWIYQKFPGFKPRFPPFQTATLDFARLRECWELPLFTFLFARSHLRIFRADIHLRKTIGDDSTAQELL
jgi:hypothetical protein